jgi:hypothetical protein
MTDRETDLHGQLNMALVAYRECNAELRRAQAELAALRVELGRQAERLGAAQARVIELEAYAAAGYSEPDVVLWPTPPRKRCGHSVFQSREGRVVCVECGNVAL